MRKTKIVATIGPTSEKPEVFTKLIEAGINVMRLNFSHGDHAEHLAKVKTLQELNEKLGKSVAFLLDTKGPEIRTGVFADGKKHELLKGNKILVTAENVPCTDDVISITYKNLTKDVKVGGHILIADSLIDLLIEKINENNVECTVQNTAILGDRKNVNIPNIKNSLEAITEKDKEDIKFAVENNFDYIAASFIRKASDVIEMRDYINSLGNTKIKIISKIENQEGLDNFDEILKVSDGIMVARGDLGSEIDIADLPATQKNLIRKTVTAGKPVITATQMLESMIKNPRPTRAEVSDVANAVYDGTSAVMLSGETAYGDYPLECVETMVKIAEASENNINYWKRFKKKNIEKLTIDSIVPLNNEDEFKQQTNFTVCCSAMFSDANAIIAVTETGKTATMLSSFKPACTIYAITANLNTYRQLSLEHGVKAIYIPNEYNYDKILTKGVDLLKKQGLLKSTDTAVLAGNFAQQEKAEYVSSCGTGSIIKIQ